MYVLIHDIDERHPCFFVLCFSSLLTRTHLMQVILINFADVNIIVLEISLTFLKTFND